MMSTDIIKYILIFKNVSVVVDVERPPENTKPTILERLELLILLVHRNMAGD